MKMIEIFLAVILLPLFAGIFTSGLHGLFECQRLYTEKSRAYFSDLHIANSFRDICMKSKEKEADFYRFAEDYKNLFGLEAIHIEKLAFKKGETLVKCSWEREGQKYRAYGLLHEKANKSNQKEVNLWEKQ